jgi:heme oxygenase
MLLRLALETAQHQHAADDDRLAVMEAKSVDDYRAWLTAVYGFELKVEQAIARVVELDTAMLRERLKMGRLREDLTSLGLSPTQIGRLPTATNIALTSAPQALGWMFVLERQSLMSGIIVRHLIHELGDVVRGASRYLSAYGEQPGARFRELGELLNAAAQRHAANTIIAAAHDAFRAQRQWYLTAMMTAPTPRRHELALPI